MFRRLEFNGNAHVGVFARTNDAHTFICPQLTDRDYVEVKEALGTDTVQITAGGGRIVGSLVAINSRAALVSNLMTESETAPLRTAGYEVGVLDHRINAAGNNVLVNDKAALVHPGLGADTVDRIASLFDVEARSGTIAGIPTVGMAGVVTNKGLLVHPRASREEVQELATFFGVEADIGTVNHGAPYIGSGIIANTKGAVTGSPTTGIEIGRIEEALGLY